MAPNSEEEGPRLTSVKDGIWSSHDDSNNKVSEADARHCPRLKELGTLLLAVSCERHRNSNCLTRVH
jgi:hypothetical protein